MANEATLIIETELPIAFTCADGTGIEKGTLLRATDPFSTSAHSAENQTVGGVAAAEKIASDGITKLPVYRRGIFKVYLSGSVSAGDPLTLATPANYVMKARQEKDVSGSYIWGIALESGSTNETIIAELNPTVIRYN